MKTKTVKQEESKKMNLMNNIKDNKKTKKAILWEAVARQLKGAAEGKKHDWIKLHDNLTALGVSSKDAANIALAARAVYYNEVYGG